MTSDGPLHNLNVCGLDTEPPYLCPGCRHEHGAALTAVLGHAAGKRPAEGKVRCPACGKGELSYEVGRDGHVRMRCAAFPCVAVG